MPIRLVVNWTGEINTSLFPFAPENLISRDRFDRAVLRQPANSPDPGLICGAYSWAPFFPPAFRGGVHLYRPSPSFQSRAYRLTKFRTNKGCLPRRVRREKASSPRGSLSNGFCLFTYGMDQVLVYMCAIFSQTHSPCSDHKQAGLANVRIIWAREFFRVVGNQQYAECVCVFIKLHITTQSGPVILVILCHSH